MTEYALAPTAAWDAATSAYRTPRVMLEVGQLQAYRVRANGTMRHLALYPLGSTERDTAEWISDAVDFDGRSVDAVARELHVSTATVRRYLEGLELTEEVESNEWDGLTFGTDGEPVFDTAFTEEDQEAEVSTTDEIMNMLDNPPTVADLIEADWADTAQAAKDAALLARNQARFTKTAGSDCEPTGTTSDELAKTLTDSVAAAGAAVAVCFCNELGQHAPGAAGCKHPAVARKVRSH